ncbi:MAG: YybH family protein [Alphaproteobacteria bacterium]
MFEFNRPEEDRRSIEVWLEGFEREIDRLDYQGARARFDERVVTFSLQKDVVSGLDEFEREQWRTGWHRASDMRWHTEGMRAMVSPDRLMAFVALTLESTGYHEDGRPFERPARASFVLVRERVGAPWKGIHVHVSLRRGVPPESHGKRGPAPA